MDMSQTDPQTINADPVDYASSKAFGSPFVEAAWASICVRIRKDDSDLLLNFNDTQA